MTSRRVFLATAIGWLVVEPFPVEGQRSAARIGLLDVGARAAWWDAFRQQMRELGYVEGQNVTFHARLAGGRIERLPALAAELVKMKMDVIVTAGNLAAQAAKRATTSIPIVMGSGADQAGLGIVGSLARPGGNITGVTSLQAELGGKRLGLLKDVVPRLACAAYLLAEGDQGVGISLRDIYASAATLDVSVNVFGVRRPYNFEAAFSDMERERADVVLIPSVAAYFSERKRLADLALKHRLPSIGGAREWAEAGLLLSYGASYPKLFRRAAYFVDKILKGAKPADLPIEQPTEFELVVNAKTAKTLGITIPPSVLARADEIIE